MLTTHLSKYGGVYPIIKLIKRERMIALFKISATIVKVYKTMISYFDRIFSSVILRKMCSLVELREGCIAHSN